MRMIIPIPPDEIANLWPRIGPHLIRGAQIAEGCDVSEELGRVERGEACIWSVWEADRCVAAMIVSVVHTSDGKLLDIGCLGGSGSLRWGKDLTKALADFAALAECERMVCVGRKALRRTYPGFRVVREQRPGIYIYERAV